MLLTEQQKKNWRYVLNYMMDKTDKVYNHGSFNADATSNRPCCVCSYVFLSGFYGEGVIPKDGYPNNTNDAFYNTIIVDFGKDSFDHIFDNGSDFDQYAITSGLFRDNISVAEVAKELWKYIFNEYVPTRVASDIIKVTVYYKNNSIDYFSTVADANNYLEMNPHRKMKKMTVTKKKMVYEEVEEEI